MNKAILEGLSPSTNNFAQSKKNNTTSWPTPDWATNRWDNIRRDYSLDDLNIILEHDEYNNIDMKEQSLVMSFEKNSDFKEGVDPDSLHGGIASEHAVLIKNTFAFYIGSPLDSSLTNPFID